MHHQVMQLMNTYGLDITSPFEYKNNNVVYKFQCLIRGYGAKSGMVIDPDWRKLNSLKQALSDDGFGYSCMDIEGSIDIPSFSDVLADWGKSA